VYAEHPMTEVLCLCWHQINETGETQAGGCWRPGDLSNSLFDLANLAFDPEVVFEAHNAGFEQMIWRHIMVPRHRFPEIPIERWSCTMAQAYVHGLPGELERLGHVLKLHDQKDSAEAKFVYGLSSPLTLTAWKEMQPAGWTSTKIAWEELYRQRNPE